MLSWSLRPLDPLSQRLHELLRGEVVLGAHLLTVDARREVLGHLSALHGLDAHAFELGAEVDQRLVAIQLATESEPFGTNGLASELNLESVGLSQSSTTLVRISNSVAYFLPAMGGLFGVIQVAAGEGNTTGQKYTGGRLGYAAGPFSIAGAYGVTPKTGTMLTDYKDTNFGGSWAFGPFALMGQWGKTEYNNLSQEKWLLGGTWTMGQGTLKASYVKADGSGTYTTPTGTKIGLSGDQFGLGYQYDLSKRTALYTTYAKISNGGDAATGSRYSVQQGGPAMKFGGESSSGFAVGMRHSF